MNNSLAGKVEGVKDTIGAIALVGTFITIFELDELRQDIKHWYYSVRRIPHKILPIDPDYVVPGTICVRLSEEELESFRKERLPPSGEEIYIY